MLARLREKSSLRAFVAMATAYVVALQMVLAAILAPQMALAASTGADFLVICHGDAQSPGKDTPFAPTPHDACAVCVQTHATAAAAAAEQPTLHRSVTYTRFAAAAPVAPAKPRHHDPRSSQGPPQSV